MKKIISAIVIVFAFVFSITMSQLEANAFNPEECDSPTVCPNGEVWSFVCSSDICGNGTGGACGVCVTVE
tara:strand:+ start:1038 stop:1247 length:210 start_codon:yes stop_codon:yes gene_type:complete